MTDLLTGVFGLVGVVVGAIVTGGVQLFLDGRNERRSVERAKRLVAGELQQAITVLRSTYGAKQWPQVVDISQAFDTSAWFAYRHYLAREIDVYLWTRLVTCYAGLPVTRATYAAALALKQTTLDEGTAEAFMHQAKNMNNARKDLGGLDIPFPELDALNAVEAGIPIVDPISGTAYPRTPK